MPEQMLNLNRNQNPRRELEKMQHHQTLTLQPMLMQIRQ